MPVSKDLPQEVTVTYLEMRAPPGQPGRPLPPGTLVMRAHRPTVAFYRFLYSEVGRPWRWTDRDRIPDEDLEKILQQEHIHIHVLYQDGVPAGFAELDYRKPLQAHLLYFGLMPHRIGKGLGSPFLDWVIREAWGQPIERLWLHTCTLDHPRALPVYRAHGFVPYREETVQA